MSDASGLNSKLVKNILERGDDLDFTKHFWRECEPLESDIKQYRKFVSVLKAADAGLRVTQIAQNLRASPSTLYTWVNLVQMPKLAHYLRQFLKLGIPRSGRVWLTLETSHGYAIPVGQFVQVPVRIDTWSGAEDVLTQIRPIEPLPNGLNRNYLLGFFLGMMVGDGAKSKSKGSNAHRHLGLVLSKEYDTNVRLGDFTCVCARGLGLRMHRTEDLAPRNKPHGFYEWVSQASPLIDWLYNVALGLGEEELTTYDPVRMDWALDAPAEFRTGLVQGLAESDGSVNITAQEVEFWVGPNWTFMENLLATFKLKSFKNREAVALAKTEAVKAFHIPTFSSALKTVRYQRHEKLALSKKLARGGERLSPELREEIRALREKGLSTNKIIEEILETHGLLISFEAAERWGRHRTLQEEGDYDAARNC